MTAFKRAGLILLATLALAAGAADVDSAVIQNLDFLQHQDMLKDRELLDFFVAVHKRSGTKPASKPSDKVSARAGSDQTAAGGSK